MNFAVVLVLGLAAQSAAVSVSPIQKVVQLLEECKAKVAKDLAAEAAEMEKYTTFCDDELKDKGYAISTAERQIVDLNAQVEDAVAETAELEDEIAKLGTELAEKDKELSSANAARGAAHEAFVATEKEMLTSIDELMRAVSTLKN